MGINLLTFFHTSFVTLPVYSLVVHMGADWTHHIVGTTVKARMKELAQQVGVMHSAAPPSVLQVLFIDLLCIDASCSTLYA